jgi:hypothetical protein
MFRKVAVSRDRLAPALGRERVTSAARSAIPAGRCRRSPRSGLLTVCLATLEWELFRRQHPEGPGSWCIAPKAVPCDDAGVTCYI